MPTAYYKRLNVQRIDAAGVEIPVPGITLDVYNVTAAVGLGTVTVDDGSFIPEGSFSAVVGDVVEFSHATYPLTIRQTLTTTQDEAYLHADNNAATYIVENQFATFAVAPTADVYAQDLDNLNLPPVFLGKVPLGATTQIPYQSSIGQNLRIYLVGKDDTGQRSATDLNDAEFEDVVIPALGGSSGGLAPLFDRYNDATTVGMSVETLYNNVIRGGRLGNIGDKVLFKYAGRYASNANAGKYVFVDFAGTDIADSDDQSGNDTGWQLDGSLIRIDADSVRYESEFSAGGVVPQIRAGQIDALTFTYDYELKLQCRTVTAAGDVTALMGYAYLVPAAPAEPDYLTMNGEIVTMNGQALTFTP